MDVGVAAPIFTSDVLHLGVGVWSWPSAGMVRGLGADMDVKATAPIFASDVSR